MGSGNGGVFSSRGRVAREQLKVRPVQRLVRGRTGKKEGALEKKEEGRLRISWGTVPVQKINRYRVSNRLNQERIRRKKRTTGARTS